MGLEIYKTGQGKYARSLAYLLGAGLVVFGGIRLFATINVPGQAWAEGVPIIGEVSAYKVIAAATILFGFLLLHLLLNRPASVDLLIDTEQELKKVSWPSRREVQNATIVVVLTTFALALVLYGSDAFLHWIFQLVY